MRLLETHRDELNARFARGAGDLAPETMLDYLRRTVMPILEMWRGEAPAPVLFALFELGIAGLRAGFADFERDLREYAPQFQDHVERAPGPVLRALGNGYLHVQRDCSTAAATTWLATLAAGAARCADREALFELGCVLGWRAGLAEARETALALIPKLDASLRQTLFGTDTLDADPDRRFCRPGARGALGALELVGRAGGFVGFGGPFRLPPRPAVVADRLVCTDGAGTFELFADVYGVRFRPAPWAHAAAIEAPARFEPLATSVDLAGASASATVPGMTAVALGDSHVVLVLGRREATAPP